MNPDTDDDRLYICSDGQVRLGMEAEPGGVTKLRPLADGESKADAVQWLRERQDSRGGSAGPRAPTVTPAEAYADVAPPPARVEPQAARKARELLTDQEFAVLDILAEADARFMAIPQAEDQADQRALWRHHLVVLEGLVMRRAAIRAYPQRFVAEQRPAADR